MAAVRVLPPYSGNQFRQARFARFLGMVEAVLRERGACSILDVGGTPAYWPAFGPRLLSDRRVSITALNIEVSAEDMTVPGVQALAGDATAMPQYADGSFDLVHSNSVIEHVGLWPRMAAMAAEMRRVGRQYFVQTPYWGFPYEPHFRAPFFHWLPEQWRYRLLLRFSLGYGGRRHSVAEAMIGLQSAMMLDRGQFEALFPQATIYSEVYMGLVKSLVAVGGEGLPRLPDSNRRRLRV